MGAEKGGGLGFTHRWVPATEPGRPVLLLLHGTGGDENDLIPFGRALLPGAALLSPRGKVLENGMPRFFRRIAEGVFDLEDLELRTRELGDFVRAASVEYGFDPGRVFAVGFSNGANIAASLLLQDPGLLRSAVLLRAMVPFVPENPPDLAGTPVLISSGRSDSMIPPREAERLAAILRQAGARVTHEWDEGGHAIGPDEVRRAREWLHENAAAG